MRTETANTIFRSDYKAPTFLIEKVELGFDLDPERTVVANRMRVVRNRIGPLVLAGESLELLSVAIDGRTLSPKDYSVTDEALTIPMPPDQFILDIATAMSPVKNTSLMGLYLSNGNFFTQCEAEAFRKITYFLDRPDVMARFTVMLRADRKKFPVLLSNGNLIEEGLLPDGRHYAKWEDPFPKPSYLFALVAARLVHIERHFETRSKRRVLLQIYTEKQDIDKAGYALDALVDAMRWDEKRFGLELDLERFMIVAVGDYNQGAMENKGLNIFNTAYVLATPGTATDVDFANIESVVGHEYFHNWTGNRVTCRDWFQLTLKEGLTVFRDQEFSADMAAGYLSGQDAGPRAQTARAVNRIGNVRALRANQFSEDASPMAHPIRPESYQEINNFYTATVYQKGSEVVRMQQTLLGRDGFRLAIDEYFRRHDGHAVTCDDFVNATEFIYKQQRPGHDFSVFRRWYSQAGTPRVMATGTYDAAQKTYTLRLRQSCPKVGLERKSDKKKQPFFIPFAIGLLGRDGRDLPLKLRGEPITGEVRAAPTTRVLDFTRDEETFVFTDLAEEPVPSLLRGFSAPVIVEFDYGDEALAHLSEFDSDAFNRWEAGQRFALHELVRLAKDAEAGLPLSFRPSFLEIYRRILADPDLDPALKDLALSLPPENRVGEELPVYNPGAVHAARSFLRAQLAHGLKAEWQQAYDENLTPGKYSPEPSAAGRRALKNNALSYLCQCADPKVWKLAAGQYRDASNMTDRMAALVALVYSNAPEGTKALAAFYRRFQNDPLIVDKWLRVQAMSPEHGTSVLNSVAALTRHSAFSYKNPNKVYALLATFFFSNPAAFHRQDGSGYAFWEEQIRTLDPINPSVASRLARALDRWKKLTPELQKLAHASLKRLSAVKELSPDVAEVIGKAVEG